MNKYNKLALGVFFDALGMITYIFPGIGELVDILWAPISAWIMTKLYKGKPGKVKSKPHSYNEAVAAKLWEISETLTGEKFIL